MKARREPVRVMVVEDSTTTLQLLVHIISSDPRFVIVAALDTAEKALEQLSEVRPDVISMDIRLPGMDGLEATRRIMSERPTPIVVIAASIEDASLHISMNALRAGALSVVEKPVGPGHQSFDSVAETIRTQLYIMSQVPVIRRREAYVRALDHRRPALAEINMPEPARPPAIIGIAASTGGPPALAKMLGALPADFATPLLLVQHMGAAFMEGFAEWLNGIVPMKVRVAVDGAIAEPGTVWVAPGDRHLLVDTCGRMAVVAQPAYRGQRPSANLMFKAIARFGEAGMGILLTGMGDDGAEGLATIKQAGGFTVAEHESSAVVYGMPAAAVRQGAVCVSMPLDSIAPRLLHYCGYGR
ncbi:chemotaxis-specific protein-glutamate methyltransferase CheB [Rhodoligotrophos defluvii]|uniref:chemotaxis-specific protein-glutamate methyltransferase CheB n=1 Tax=Rhodoligotrophos defluvii TaxID=2561934 RepID=UPI001EF07E42|nr:chemotaxis-specific protein-glutamate methyltransferase CheB [Rhodoligotrophos defluvii]